MRSQTLFAIVFASTAVSLSADNWPHWRGPSRNGISTEKNLPVKWSAASTDNIAWKLPMPALSGSTPIVWGDRIFLNVADAGWAHAIGVFSLTAFVLLGFMTIVPRDLGEG